MVKHLTKVDLWIKIMDIKVYIHIIKSTVIEEVTLMKHIDQIYPKSPSQCNCMNIRRAAHGVTQFYEKVLQPCGLTVPQLGLLNCIQMADHSTINQLAKSLRIDRTTLNRNMKPLAEAGFIAVYSGQDSRTRQVVLTQSGKETLEKGLVLWAEAQASLKEYLGEADLAKLVQLLSKLEALVP
jgi:DNA-binding MarR family transcriptional regulator